METTQQNENEKGTTMTTPKTPGQSVQFTPDPRGKSIPWGVALNKVRSLQRKWNYWFPLRQHNPLSPQDVQQSIAEKMCASIAPKLYAAKEELERIERELDRATQ